MNAAEVAILLIGGLLALCIRQGQPLLVTTHLLHAGWIGPPRLKDEDLLALRTFNDIYRCLSTFKWRLNT